MVSADEANLRKAKLLKYLTENGVEYELREHDIVMTVEEQAKYIDGMKGVPAKNLLLKDKKGRLILISAATTTKVDLKSISQRLGLGKSGLRMAPDDALTSVLQVPLGSATPFALVHESARPVGLILDKNLREGGGGLALFHPNNNNATIGVSCSGGLDVFLRSIGREPAYVDLLTEATVGKEQPPDLAHLLPSEALSSSSSPAAAAAAATPNSAGAPTASASSASKSTPPEPAAAAAAKGGKAQKGKQQQQEATKAGKAASAPPGDDVDAACHSVLDLVIALAAQHSVLVSESSDAAADEPAHEKDRAEGFKCELKQELQHLLVMFKNSAYASGFSAGRQR
eukprot:TRINITY_DN2599_c0_g1_i1.p1 TRINITY_DN2599_c0_g1~~TRINITY_DN2599_c0_g1_i1.p1  ORF type:complete len:391 (-),score=130.25 TRINITY_DN2599_c0_g1_i1:192-1217(-)